MRTQNLTDEEIGKLELSCNEKQWNAVCDEVKAARNGQYPQDWYPRVMLGGIFTAAQARWATPSNK